MAMLAEPRRKQKVINLRAKTSAWSNDPNKFGQRMLEKMGWSSGKGLGAKENGIVEHVVAKYKNDDKGLGYEDRNDQWTKHEDDFNALLSNLSNGDKQDDKLHSGVSLEVKSKKSKARVHYHKYTRGKDLTRYSEKDLANIFGKKTLKEEEKVEEPLPSDVKTTEQVFTEKGSMEDYFKNKLAAFKSQSKSLFSNTAKNYDDAECGFQGFSNTNDGDDFSNPGFGFQPFSNTENNSLEGNDLVECMPDKPVKKKKKKKSKRHDEESLLPNEGNNDITNPCVPGNNSADENEKSRKKHKLVEVTEHEPVIKKKKKKQKNNIEYKDCEENTMNESGTQNSCEKEQQPLTEDCHVPKKKKKRKHLE